MPLVTNALKQAKDGSPLGLYLTSPDGCTQVRLDIRFDEEFAHDSYVRVRYASGEVILRSNA